MSLFPRKPAATSIRDPEKCRQNRQLLLGLHLGDPATELVLQVRGLHIHRIGLRPGYTTADLKSFPMVTVTAASAGGCQRY